jgi:hypothetical protein
VSDEELVNEMERIRSANNVNWMNLVRLALRVAPTEARAIFADIQQKDREIAGIIQQLGRTT